MRNSFSYLSIKSSSINDYHDRIVLKIIMDRNLRFNCEVHILYGAVDQMDSIFDCENVEVAQSHQLPDGLRIKSTIWSRDLVVKLGDTCASL